MRNVIFKQKFVLLKYVITNLSFNWLPHYSQLSFFFSRIVHFQHKHNNCNYERQLCVHCFDDDNYSTIHTYIKKLYSDLILIVNLTRLRITQETFLWFYLGRPFQRELPEAENPPWTQAVPSQGLGGSDWIKAGGRKPDKNKHSSSSAEQEES